MTNGSDAISHRPELTWRDIQHLCVETARVVDPEDHDWERTAAGRLYNNKFGYGALDAYAYVKAAQIWKLVKPQAWLHSDTIQINGGRTHDYGHGNYTYEGGEKIRSHGFESALSITKKMLLDNNLELLEHIDVRVWISHSRRGDVEVELISPNGIKSILAKKRPFDDATTGYPGWRFMTVKHWYVDLI
jgi:kexin